MTTLVANDAVQPQLEAPLRARTSGCWFQRLSPEQQLEVVAANERGVSSTEIAWVLKKWGEGAASSSLALHFRGGCACRRR